MTIRPAKLWRWYKRAARLKYSDNKLDRMVFRWDYEHRLCWMERLIVWLMKGKA